MNRVPQCSAARRSVLGMGASIFLSASLLVACTRAPAPAPAAAPSGKPTAPFSPHIVPPGQGTPTGYLGGGTTLLFQGRAGTDEVSVLDVVLPPRSLGSPPHLHHNEDEYFYVVEGDLTVLIGNEERIASRGTHAALPRELRHAYWNDRDAPAHVLITIAPGRFAQFFLDVAEDLKKRGATDPRQIGQLIAEHAKQYGCDVYLDQIPALMEQHHLR